MKTLTWADFAKHEPCYNPAEKYGNWQGTILDLMQHPEIPAKDKVWAFTREGIVGDKTLRLFAVGCAKKVQHLMKDQRSIDALDVAERYANGNATKDEVAAARKAAWYAEWDAAGAAAKAAERAALYATQEAAWDVAREAAAAWEWAAAWDAAWDATRASAWASAGELAGAAAREAQVEIAIELLNKPR
jgi:Lon protease-like protein